jgi:beta-alanine--pyruvate transaminase
MDLAPAQGFGQRGYAALQRIYASGLVVRVTADTVILAPALIAEREHIDRICDTLSDVLSAL